MSNIAVPTGSEVAKDATTIILKKLNTFNNKLIEHCAFCGTKEVSPKDELLCFKDVKNRYCVNCKGIMLKEDALAKLKRNQELWDEFLVQIFGGKDKDNDNEHL